MNYPLAPPGQSLFDVTSDITACGEGQFSDDPAPVGDTYRSRLYKNLIGQLRSTTRVEECEIEITIKTDIYVRVNASL